MYIIMFVADIYQSYYIVKQPIAERSWALLMKTREGSKICNFNSYNHTLTCICNIICTYTYKSMIIT